MTMNVHDFTDRVVFLVSKHASEMGIDARRVSAELALVQIERTYASAMSAPLRSGIDNVRRSLDKVDPDLRDVTRMVVGTILSATWARVVAGQSFDHFRRTLEDIGATCLQGITFRLVLDWAAFSGVGD